MSSIFYITKKVIEMELIKPRMLQKLLQCQNVQHANGNLIFPNDKLMNILYTCENMFLEFHLSTVNLEKEWFNFKLPPPPSFRIFESLMNGKYKMNYGRYKMNKMSVFNFNSLFLISPFNYFCSCFSFFPFLFRNLMI